MTPQIAPRPGEQNTPEVAAPITPELTVDSELLGAPAEEASGTNKHTNIADLPVELLIKVLEHCKHVPAPPPAGPRRTYIPPKPSPTPLRECSLVCKQWRALCLPHIFIRLVLRGADTFTHLFTLVEGTPSAVRCTENLVLYGAHPGAAPGQFAEVDWARFAAVLPKMISLKTLTLSSLSVASMKAPPSLVAPVEGELDTIIVLDEVCIRGLRVYGDRNPSEVEGDVLSNVLHWLPIAGIEKLTVLDTMSRASEGVTAAEDDAFGVSERILAMWDVRLSITASLSSQLSGLGRIANPEVLPRYLTVQILRWKDVQGLVAFLRHTGKTMLGLDIDLTVLMDKDQEELTDIAAPLPPWHLLSDALAACPELLEFRVRVPPERARKDGAANRSPQPFVPARYTPFATIARALPATIEHVRVLLRTKSSTRYSADTLELWDLGALDALAEDAARFPHMCAIYVEQQWTSWPMEVDFQMLREPVIDVLPAAVDRGMVAHSYKDWYPYLGDLGEFEQHEGHIDDIGEGEEAQFKRLEAIFWREVEMKEEQRKMGIL